jgi:hypothetical protein
MLVKYLSSIETTRHDTTRPEETGGPEPRLRIRPADPRRDGVSEAGWESLTR